MSEALEEVKARMAQVDHENGMVAQMDRAYMRHGNSLPLGARNPGRVLMHANDIREAIREIETMRPMSLERAPTHFLGYEMVPDDDMPRGEFRFEEAK